MDLSILVLTLPNSGRIEFVIGTTLFGLLTTYIYASAVSALASVTKLCPVEIKG